MACVFLSAVCSINPVFALCNVHWALWAIVELFHCCWENLDPFLLFVFILGNKHTGIFCRCASSTEKIPTAPEISAGTKDRGGNIFWKCHAGFSEMTMLTFCVYIIKTIACASGSKAVVGRGCWGCPAGLPGHPCSSATRQLLFLIFFVQEIPPSCHSHSSLVFYLEKLNCYSSVLWWMGCGRHI